MMHDAGMSIDIYLDNKKVSIVNNFELYNKVLTDINNILKGEK